MNKPAIIIALIASLFVINVQASGAYEAENMEWVAAQCEKGDIAACGLLEVLGAK